MERIGRRDVDQAAAYDEEVLRLAVPGREDTRAFGVVTDEEALRQETQRLFFHFVERRVAPQENQHGARQQVDRGRSDVSAHAADTPVADGRSYTTRE